MAKTDFTASEIWAGSWSVPHFLQSLSFIIPSAMRKHLPILFLLVRLYAKYECCLTYSAWFPIPSSLQIPEATPHLAITTH